MDDRIKQQVEIAANPFTIAEIVSGYETWYQTIGRRAVRQEKSLLKQLLAMFPKARTILEPGCGTGHFTRWLGDQGLRPVGLDLSAAMLQEANQVSKGTYVLGNALRMPFQADSFDLVALITSLEFFSDPVLALTEALRVARQGLILGVLNADSRLGRQYKRLGGSIWESARFFTPSDLKHAILEITGEQAKVFWRTTLWPYWPGALPFMHGGFIGMAVEF